jgi:hypothetical protein
VPPLPSITGVNIFADPTVASPPTTPYGAPDQPVVAGFPGASKVNNLYSRIDQIIRRLREADELHKPELVKELEKAISEEFDADMKHRETELTKLEERVAKLRAQFERRKKAKAEITQLQTKVLVNEVDGLGFSHPQYINSNQIRSLTPTTSPMFEGAPAPDTELFPQNPQPSVSPFSSDPQRAVAPPPSASPR